MSVKHHAACTRGKPQKHARGFATREPVTGTQFQTFGCQAIYLHSQLSLALDPEHNARDKYLVDSFLSKLGTEAISAPERAAKAVRSWYSDEEHNARTTRRLKRYWDEHTGSMPYASGQHSDPRIRGIRVDSLLQDAADLIAAVLPDWSHSFYEHGSFTNGASVGYSKDRGDPVFKYSGRVTATSNAYGRVYALISSTPLWKTTLIEKFGSVEAAIQIVGMEKGFTVPKNAETDRFCSKQATGNMQTQKAIGYIIRKSLRSVGINLNDQSRNRDAARRASRSRYDATIDLKSASNSLVVELCRLLLPLTWFKEIMAARSPFCQPDPNDDTLVKTNMVGAMGNGFTFELESLIFWALAEVCRRATRSRGRVLVFGDDVVAPVKCIHHVMALYGFCGFRINRDKSFWTGDFRESCGGHYKNGVDVTPIYARKPITDTTKMIWFLNKLRAWAGCGYTGNLADERLWPLYNRLRRKYVCTTLWGGCRSNSITSLHSPGPKRRRLAYKLGSTRLYGAAALLRTFQYMSPASAGLLAKFAPFHGDIQAYYEVFGSIPITTSSERLTSVSDTPVYSDVNTEQFDDALAWFPSELLRA